VEQKRKHKVFFRKPDMSLQHETNSLDKHNTYHYHYLFLIRGLDASPFALKQNLQVQSEYLSGMLTANGILFALWGIIIERKPQKGMEKWIYETSIIVEFFFPFFLFAASLLFVTLTALNLFSSVLALVFCSLSFFINAALITLALYIHKFKARPSESEP
jgi:hypothetical protein